MEVPPSVAAFPRRLRSLQWGLVLGVSPLVSEQAEPRAVTSVVTGDRYRFSSLGKHRNKATRTA